MALRIGILGAARIAPMALIRPARAVDDVEVAAVAARDRARAAKFAKKHDIGVVHASYEELLADDTIDAIYNPLPNGLHGRWTIAAIEAGKHVLCEKPFTANAEEARAVAAAAGTTDRVVMEAFHWRYHPQTARILDIIASGEIGDVRHVETRMCVPLPLPRDIRWQLDLAGGSMMDVGCYALHQARTFAGGEPAVTRASIKEARAGVDRWAQADLIFPGGVTGRITASLLTTRLLSIAARIEGSAGTISVVRPTAPQYFGSIKVRAGGVKRTERADRTPTYTYQLRAFAGAVLRGEDVPTDLDDAIANMEAIDAVYRAAGLDTRQPTAQ